jgi:hypothetical protein
VDLFRMWVGHGIVINHKLLHDKPSCLPSVSLHVINFPYTFE